MAEINYKKFRSWKPQLLKGAFADSTAVDVAPVIDTPMARPASAPISDIESIISYSNSYSYIDLAAHTPNPAPYPTPTPPPAPTPTCEVEINYASQAPDAKITSTSRSRIKIGGLTPPNGSIVMQAQSNEQRSHNNAKYNLLKQKYQEIENCYQAVILERNQLLKENATRSQNLNSLDKANLQRKIENSALLERLYILQKSADDANAERDQIKNKFSIAENSNALLQEMVKKLLPLEQSCEQLTEELQTTTSQLEAARSFNNELQDKLHTANLQLDELAELKIQYDKSLDNIKVLEQQLRLTQSQHVAYKQKHQHAVDNFNELSTHLQKATANNNNYAILIDKIRQKNANLHMQVKCLDDKNHELASENTRLRNCVDNINPEYNAMHEWSAEWQKKFHVESQKRLAAEKEVKDVLERLKKVQDIAAIERSLRQKIDQRLQRELTTANEFHTRDEYPSKL